MAFDEAAIASCRDAGGAQFTETARASCRDRSGLIMYGWEALHTTHMLSGAAMGAGDGFLEMPTPSCRDAGGTQFTEAALGSCRDA